MAIDGNYAQHLQNGGCPTMHHNGRWYCQGRVGHYNWFTSRHYTRVFDPINGYTAVEWN